LRLLSTFSIRFILFVALQTAAATAARAQAWVPAGGEGSITFTYQNYDVAGHFGPSGNKNKNGPTHSQSVVSEVDYGITDNLGLTVSLPFIASKYTGPQEYVVAGNPTYPGPLDDGSYHAAFQDVRIEGRRVFWAKSIAVAPFGGISFPTHDYETVGEAVPGRHRRDYQVGASAGSDLGGFGPTAYVQVRYAYGKMQEIDGFPFTRSNIDFEGGKELTSRLLLRGLVNWQIRHQGPTYEELTPDWVNHDRFIAPSFVNVGGGASLSLMRSAEVYALYAVTVAGSNGAHRGRLFAVGTTWAFGRSLGGLIGGHNAPFRTHAIRPAAFPSCPGAVGCESR
jgi:hypothetical protein